jgi:hypothetical protein
MARVNSGGSSKLQRDEAVDIGRSISQATDTQHNMIFALLPLLVLPAVPAPAIRYDVPAGWVAEAIPSSLRVPLAPI